MDITRSRSVSDQVVQNLVSYYLDHVEAQSGGNAGAEEIAMEADELVKIS